MKSRSLRRSVVAALAGAVMLAALARPARAQSEEELKAARELFQEAYKDEQEKRHEAALEKFERVARVKESASVRYRIANNLEALGRLREARDAFRALAVSRATLAPNEQEIAKDSAERAHALDRRIPRLVIRLEGWPAETRTTVDGGAVPASATARTVDVDPGPHVVTATAPGVAPYESKVSVFEGGEVKITIPPPAIAEPTGTPPVADTTQAAEPNRTLGYVALGAGGVLLVSSIIVLVAREGDIGKLEDRCPNNVCPTAEKDELESAKSRAEAFGPLGVGLGVIGLAAAGLGAYLVLRPGPPTSAPPQSTTSVRVDPRVVRGGAMLSLQTSF